MLEHRLTSKSLVSASNLLDRMIETYAKVVHDEQ